MISFSLMMVLMTAEPSTAGTNPPLEAASQTVAGTPENCSDVALEGFAASADRELLTMTIGRRSAVLLTSGNGKFEIDSYFWPEAAEALFAKNSVALVYFRTARSERTIGSILNLTSILPGAGALALGPLSALIAAPVLTILFIGLAAAAVGLVAAGLIVWKLSQMQLFQAIDQYNHALLNPRYQTPDPWNGTGLQAERFQ